MFIELKDYSPADYDELEIEEEPLYVVARVVLSIPPERLATTPQSFVLVDEESKTYIQRELLGELVADGASRYQIPYAIIDAVSNRKFEEAVAVLADNLTPAKLYGEDVVFDTVEELVEYIVRNGRKVEACECANIEEDDLPITLLIAQTRHLRIMKILDEKAVLWICKDGRSAVKARNTCFHF